MIEKGRMIVKVCVIDLECDFGAPVAFEGSLLHTCK